LSENSVKAYFLAIVKRGTEHVVAEKILKLEDATDEVYNMAFESSKRFTISLPSGSGKLCFVDYQNPSSNPDKGWETNEILTKMVTSYKNNVVMLYPDGRYKDGKEIQHLSPYRGDNFCIESTAEFLLRNEGKYVSITIRQD